MEFLWVLLFYPGITKGCHIILLNFQGCWKLFFSGISKVKVTNLKFRGGVSENYILIPRLVFSVAHLQWGRSWFMYILPKLAGPDQGLIWQWCHRFWARENWHPKKHFPVKNKPVSVTKRPLFTSKLAFYSFLEVFRATKWSKTFVRLI